MNEYLPSKHVRRPCGRCGKEMARYCNAKICLACHKTSGADKAIATVANAVRRGKLSPARAFACADCGNPAYGYDHRDYNRPLDVQPVCRSCNRRRGPAIPVRQPWQDALPLRGEGAGV